MSNLAQASTEPKLNWLKQNNSMQTFLLASVSSVLLWLAFPRIGVWPLAWIATIPLIWLTLIEKLPGNRPYRQLLLAGFIYWLVAYHFIRIPHWLLNFAWLALAAYFAIYTPLFVAAARAMIHRYNTHPLLAVPIAWTGIEWMRTNFFTGLGMGLLSHSQFQQPLLIQMADLSGAYAVSYMMVLFATGIAVTLLRYRSSLPSVQRFVPLVGSCVTLAIVIGYGQYRLTEPIQYRGDKTLVVGLIQPSIDVVFRPLSDQEKNSRWEQHRDLTEQARERWDDLDLIVWPESSFDSPDLLSDANSDVTADYFIASNRQLYMATNGNAAGTRPNVPLLSGGSTHDPANNDIFNSAILFSTDGRITDRYYKSHLVFLGEYVPFAEWFPFLDGLTPIGKGLSRGKQFSTMEVAGVRIAPSVCFETCVPHYIRRQVNELKDAGTEPDVLINVTNDGWFFGTSCLDLHLASNVFRAVETRKPHLVAANTGFSAQIDSSGRLIQTGPRRETAVLRASVRPIERSSLYLTIGDALPFAFAVLSLAVFIPALRKRQSGTRSEQEATEK